MSDILTEIVGGTKERKKEAEKRKRQEKAAKDFGFFCSYYLPHYFSLPAAEYQKILTEVENLRAVTKDIKERLKKYIKKENHIYLSTGKLEGFIAVEPREHGKTVRYSLAKPLWYAVTQKARYILLISASQEAANEQLANIKTELEENERILEDFGDLRGDEWKTNRIELSVPGGACIQAKGAGSAMRGIRYRQYRPDLIILDDILKDQDVESASIRNKLYLWTKRVVFMLGKTAFIIIVNTIFHSDDVVSRLLKEIKEQKLSGWAACKLQCYTPQGEPIWPEKWSKKDLEEKRKKLGASVFATELLNQPLSDEERIIKPEWISYYEDIPDTYRLLRIGAVDPAAGRHDMSAMVTIGLAPDGRIYVLDSMGANISESELLEQVIARYIAYNHHIIVWEDIAFQAIYRRMIAREAAARGVYLPVSGIHPDGSKEIRIRRLSPLVENKLLLFRKEDKELIEQLTMFPRHSYDDLPDALAYAVMQAQSTKMQNPVVIPTNYTRTTKILRRRPGKLYE